MLNETEMTQLLTVKETFLLEQRGLVVAPNFPAPNNNWKNLTEIVVVKDPKGAEKKVAANFQIEHLIPTDPDAPNSFHFRIVVSFPKCLKEDIPIGSIIFCSTSAKEAIAPS